MTYKTENTNKGLIPRQGFFVQFRNQPHKGILHYYHEALNMALVSFQTETGEWGEPEFCDMSDLLLWSEGKKPLRVLMPCIVMFQRWKGEKCLTCHYRDQTFIF